MDKKLSGDIDIDVSDRSLVLKHIKHIPASMRNVSPIRKHATGIYVTDIPYDPINDMASIDYTIAEDRGYFKIDLLNVHIYSQVRDENHLLALMREPDYTRLTDKGFVEKLIHLNGQFHNISRLLEPIDSLPRLAMFLALIRPGKKHLIGKSWKEISKTIWDKGTDGYIFKASHSCAYAHLVVVHMNLLEEQELLSV